MYTRFSKLQAKGTSRRKARQAAHSYVQIACVADQGQAAPDQKGRPAVYTVQSHYVFPQMIVRRLFQRECTGSLPSPESLINVPWEVGGGQNKHQLRTAVLCGAVTRRVHTVNLHAGSGRHR